jgi:type IV secretory pathway VirB2 component (pilin)
MLEEGGTTYNTTAVNESSVRKLKPPRLLFSMLLGVTFFAMVGGSYYFRTAAPGSELQLDKLPAPSEMLIKINRFLHTPAGTAIAVFCFLTVLFMTLKGVLDRVLKLLIGLNVVWLAAFLLASFGTLRLLSALAEKLKDGK